MWELTVRVTGRTRAELEAALDDIQKMIECGHDRAACTDDEGSAEFAITGDGGEQP